MDYCARFALEVALEYIIFLSNLIKKTKNPRLDSRSVGIGLGLDIFLLDLMCIFKEKIGLR